MLPVGGLVARVPDGAALTTVAALRLARRLERCGPEVEAVAAPVAPVPPGSSATTDATRRGRRPWRPLAGVAVAPDRWVGVHRPGWAGPATGGEWPSDPDVASHRHDTAPDPVVDATTACRPLLTTGPVVVLLALGGASGRAELGRAWATALLERGVEPRLAIADGSPGSGLVPPCSPTAASLAALRPDVVVALDPAAAAVVPGWVPAGEHSRVDVVDGVAGVEVVPWRIGAPTGDLHARVGPATSADDLAALLARLCGLPPRRPHDVMETARPSGQVSTVEVLKARRDRRARPQVTTAVLLGRPRDAAEGAWWAAVTDQLAGLGVAVTTSDGPALEGDPDLVLVGRGPGLDQLAARRLGADRPVARLALAGDDLTGAVPVLVPSEALVAQADGAPARALAPTVRRERQRDLRAASTRRGTDPGRLVVWDLAAQADVAAPASRAPALAAGLGPDVALVVRADDPDLAAAVARAGGGRAATDADLADAAAWRAVVWDPAPGHVEATGALGLGVEGLLARVPVVAGPDGVVGAPGLAPPVPRLGPDPDGCAATLAEALATPGGVLARRQVQARILHGEQAVAVRGHRVLGWLVRRSGS